MSDSLSIAIVCYPSLGGSGVVASDLAAGLARRGHRVDVIASAPPSRTLPDCEGLSFHPVSVSDYPLFDHPPYELAVASAIVELARTQRLDVVHVHYAVPHAASAHLARQVLGSNAPRLATTLHGTDVTRIGSDPRYRDVVRFTVAASDGLTAPSEFLRGEAKRLLDGSDAARIEVIPNFVDTDRFSPAARRDRTRLAALFPSADSGAEGDAPVLFHVSNFRSVKRAADLIDVLVRLRRAVPARLVLVGDGPDREPVAQRARDLGVESSVCFLGDRTDFVDQLRDADAFLLSSESESFGVAALEALSCGVPVFGYRVGGLPEVVGDAGMLVDPFDVDGLAGAVLDGITDPTRRTALGRAARARAVEHFDRAPAIARYEAFYRRLLSAASILIFLAVSLLSLQRSVALAEEPAMHAGMLAHALDRLANTGRVLYVGAHPDDENTRLLAYLANPRHVTAAYLTMTRGGGGQNLIGTEQAELLDVIRTQELLAARRLDGAVQRFTRMRDFGYSKTADETLAIWNHDEALADVVWVIRTFRPDVILARFDLQVPNHGHHTASAILATEAFAAAADPTRFPEQLTNGVEPWQADRLLNNWSQWRGGEPPAGSVALDVGAYDPRLGLGYGELAALSRSQHKSQGFGVAGERGTIVERFLPLAGTHPERDLLEGLNLDWSRFGTAAAPLTRALDQARRTLERDRPERALPALLEAHRALDALPDDPRVRDARTALNDIIAAACGLFVRATAAQGGAVPGSKVAVKVETVLRRPASMTLERLIAPNSAPLDVGIPLALNEKREVNVELPIAADAAVSAPYWLATPSLPGRQIVSDPRLVGAAEGPPAATIGVEVSTGGRTVLLEAPVVYAWTDPVIGERVRDFLIVPPATITPSRQAVMFPNGKAASVDLRIRAGQDALHGDVVLPVPAGWRAAPDRVTVDLAHAGDETSVRIEVTPPAGAGALEIRPEIEVDGRAWSYREDVIDHAHIPLQAVLQQASLRLVPLEIRLPKGTVGYIPGPGDTVAEDLAHVGIDVQVLDDETIRSGDLGRYAAIIVGIRAYNTRDLLRASHTRLMQYVERGGTVVVQYNTNNRLAALDTPVGPFPLAIGRDRITDETAAMIAVDPKASILNTPNVIGTADFDGWVQERGLYYAESWDDRYTPIFRTADPGENPLLGGLLVARYGQGRYVYTGLAFFRQLPAGVPGAYRLFVNLISAD